MHTFSLSTWRASDSAAFTLRNSHHDAYHQKINKYGLFKILPIRLITSEGYKENGIKNDHITFISKQESGCITIYLKVHFFR